MPHHSKSFARCGERLPTEVFFAHPENTGTLTLALLIGELRRAGLSPRITEDKVRQLWIEFDGFESRLLAMKEEPLGLITFQLYGDVETGMAMATAIEVVLQLHGYVDREQFSG